MTANTDIRTCFKLLFIIFPIIVSNLIVLALGNINCMENSDHFKCKFALVEPYRYVANLNDSKITFPDCKAEKIWLFIRHGGRLPDPDALVIMDRLPIIHKKIMDNCSNNKTCHLNNEEFEALANWTFNKIPLDQSMNLVEEGENELRGIAKRFQSRFPDLMPEKYDNTTYRFKIPTTQRGRDSGTQFTIGLFGEQQSSDVQFPVVTEKDLVLLQFYEKCDKWTQEVRLNHDTYAEYKGFKENEVVKTMQKNISERLGFDVHFNDVTAIYLMCVFDTYWDEQTKSPWCSLLSPENFEVMEFAEDLRNYYSEGYAYPITAKQACPVLLDMFNFFRSESTLKTSGYFTHSKAILKVLTLLGVADDNEPLFRNSFETTKNRLWRTSLLNPFSANIVFISFNCTTSGPSILFMLQERIVTLPGCPDNVPCPLSIMKDKYPDNEDECKFDEICSL